MFILQTEPRWTWPVEVRQPDPAGGFGAPQSFKATFRLVPPDRYEALASTATGTTQMLREAVVQLHDLVDEAGAPIPHTPELLEACLGNPWLRMALVRSYVEALAGAPLNAAQTGN